MAAVLVLEGLQCASPLPPPARPPPQKPVEPVRACPAEMAEVVAESSTFCIDRYEASLVRRSGAGTLTRWPGNQPVDGSEAEVVAVSRRGTKPQGYISGTQAALACEHAGKRLCDPAEWVRACRGPEHTRYPYGDTRRAGVCNDRFERLTGHPVTRLARENKARGEKSAKMWTPKFMNDPRLHELSETVAPSGAFPACTNGYGVVDMVGNLHEWVADPQGTFLGGFFMDTFQNGEGCEYRTRAHGFDYHDYSTGFRCCADAGSKTGP
jgi:formylglycine-generating enzyme required for sulfatase activity